MNDKKNEPDDFDNFLRAQLQNSYEYLPDDNFTANVMAKLPVQKKLGRWQERLIIVIPCTLIALLVLSQFSVIALIIKSWVWLSLIDVAGWLQLSLVIFGAGLFGVAGWFAAERHLL
ncbi:MAG: hypothetical protein V4732_10735 [Pseudomonadota bacterium]